MKEDTNSECLLSKKILTISNGESKYSNLSVTLLGKADKPKSEPRIVS